MARPGRPERNRAARSFRQLWRFDHVINSDKVFGTHSTTANQKKVFFNLRKAQSKISVLNDGDMRLDQVKIIARRIGVTEKDT